MNRWAGKVAIVTGASSGIGVAISRSLVSHGIKVVGLARRVDKLQEIAQELGKDKFYPIQCDMRKEGDILKAFKFVEKQFGGADILVNNAGVNSNKKVIESDTEEYRKVIDTNLIAPAICSREAIQSLIKRKACGHIININSIAGLYAESLLMPLGMYPASKYGLRALSTELRHEIVLSNLDIKITSISPGAVYTEMIQSFFKDKSGEEIRQLVKSLEDKDIAEAMIYALGTPESVEIPEITIIPQKTAFCTVSAELTH
ncbi:unnamed protein product [Xylocopa violacea]|uniref:Dehydrogenase/reductase SDR family member 11 n=1 Tax=Xylocopa violacea TaxID=135666 RepID=A0ABP1NU91_XYLVO